LQHRQRYSVDEKLQVLEEAAVPGMTISFVARRHGISPGLLFHWRRRMAQGAKEAVRTDDAVVSAAEVRALEKRIHELERLLGRTTPENEILRQAVKVAHEKADLAVAVVTRRGLVVKAVATTLGVALSAGRAAAGPQPAALPLRQDRGWRVPAADPQPGR
jgi:transposase